ncbi:ATP/GTP-binding protein [Lentzea cavernae]|uniref:ATP/GTP-binding protein n=1 Tax=Lentzea cavernae TaxID=2020703 RepID=A0ABQ3MZL3_9PSEU|nr:ATP/GTP-binding protein [Lentzea cavernae]
MNLQIGDIRGDFTLHHHSTIRPPAELPLLVGVVPRRAASFQERRPLPGSPTVVLSGMGGVGKTQLAAHHAASAWASGETRLLVWVTAGSREAVVSVFAEAAAELTGRDETEPERGARRLLEWLARGSEPWLVVLDDVEDPADLEGLWPPDNGRTLVTTRRRDAALHGDQRAVVDVESFSEDEGLSYLRTVLADRPQLLDGAAEVVRELGCLPLALAQAGAYMLDMHLSGTEYLSRLGKSRRTGVAGTWSLSIKQANGLRPKRVAGHLLDLACLLDPNGVPLGVLTSPRARKYLTDRTGHELDETGVRDVLAHLHRLGVVTLDTGSAHREVKVHAQVQRAHRENWSTRQLRRACRAAAEALNGVWPEVELSKDEGHVLRANGEALMAAAGVKVWVREAMYLSITLGNSIGESGRAAEARDYFDRLSAESGRLEHVLDLQTIILRGCRAHWRAKAGDPAGALRDFEQIAADEPRISRFFRRFTPHFMQYNRHDIAIMRAETGDLEGAIAGLEDVLAERLLQHGPDHSSVLSTRTSLARLRAETTTGDPLAEFEGLVPDLCRVLGPLSRETLMAKGSRAYWLARTGDTAAAITEREQLVLDFTEVFGPEHQRTLLVRADLARSLHDGGQAELAAQEGERLLADQVRILGTDHEDTEDTRRMLDGWR